MIPTPTLRMLHGEIPISRDRYSFNVRGTIYEGKNITSWAILYHERDAGRLDETVKQLTIEFSNLGAH